MDEIPSLFPHNIVGASVVCVTGFCDMLSYLLSFWRAKLMSKYVHSSMTEMVPQLIVRFVVTLKRTKTEIHHTMQVNLKQAFGK